SGARVHGKVDAGEAVYDVHVNIDAPTVNSVAVDGTKVRFDNVTIGMQADSRQGPDLVAFNVHGQSASVTNLDQDLVMDNLSFDAKGSWVDRLQLKLDDVALRVDEGGQVHSQGTITFAEDLTEVKVDLAQLS